MMKPLEVSREEFPKSKTCVEGMIPLKVTCDNYELHYEPDVAYVVRGDRTLYLQFILPITTGQEVPLIIYIPGSAFQEQNVKSRIAQLAVLARRGYAVALLEYRGSKSAPFPGQILDVKAGIRYIKQHGEQYQINSKQIFLMGDSSGAYTALMAGVTTGISQLEEYNYGEEVYGIIDFYGPTNIATMSDYVSSQDHTTPDSPEGCLIGGNSVLDHPELVAPTIIKNYIREDRTIPAILMFHGTNDELVPFEQSCELFSALREAKKDVTFYQMLGAHHGDREFWSEHVIDIIDRFIKDRL